MTHTILVTGGTGGLGQAVVAQLLRDGYHVVVTYNVAREWQAMQTAMDTAAIQAVEVDLQDEAAIAGLLQKIDGPVYGLVNLVGGFGMGNIGEMARQSWLDLVHLNLTPLLLLSNALIPAMREAGRGRIIGVSSAGMRGSPAGLSAYNVAKQGVLTFVETLAHELKDTLITANAILPGTLDTPANRSTVPDGERVPLAYVANVVSFLLGDAAQGITGAALPITVTAR